MLALLDVRGADEEAELGPRHSQVADDREEALNLAFETPAKSSVPEFIEERQPLTLVKNEMTVEELIEKAEANGFKKADIVTGAKIYHNQPNIYHLTVEQIADLDQRMTARIEKMKQQAAEARPSSAKRKVA